MFKKAIEYLLRALPIVTIIIAIPAASRTDVHIVKEIRRFSERSSETVSYSVDTWLSIDREYRASNHKILIKRYDLNRRWYIDMQSRTFAESPLDVTVKPKTEEKLHNEGFHYEPEYEWELRDGNKEEIIGGMKCRQFILDGDADFSEKLIEIWVTDSLSVKEEYREIVAEYLRRSEAHSIMSGFSELSGKFIIYERTTTKIPIVPRFSVESRIERLEEVASPPGIYELPNGLQKAGSRDF